MIIDFHAHAFPDAIAERAITGLSEHADDPPETDGTVTDLLRLMDESGVDKAVLCNIATKPAQAAAIVKWSREIASDRIVPLGSLHPESDDIERDVAAIVQAGMPGVKLHPLYQNFAVDEKKAFPLYAALEKAGLFVMMHAGYDFAFGDNATACADRFVAVLDTFPDLPIIMGHFGGWRDQDGFIKHTMGRNVWIDTSFMEGNCTEVQRDTILKGHPADRILFGTDAPWASMKGQVDYVKTWPITDAEREKIFWKNAAELLGLE